MTKLATIQTRFEYKGRKTICVISRVKDKKVLVETSVKRFIEDKPDKALGRRNAFRKAMQLIAKDNIIPRKTRTTIWKEFTSTVGQPAF